jgi:L-threonylcarbamoyladenylate synthase
MERAFFEKEVAAALEVLRTGGIILYPTDTVWGLGCDATNEKAVRRVYDIKQREDSKSLIILVAEERDVVHYVAAPDLALFDYLQEQARPTTVIYDGAINLPQNVMAPDGSIAIRITADEFCRHIIRRLRKPIVSTSANISGQPTPQRFIDIDPVIRGSVDYIVQWRQDDSTPAQPSQIIRWKNGEPIFIRK